MSKVPKVTSLAGGSLGLNPSLGAGCQSASLSQQLPGFPLVCPWNQCCVTWTPHQNPPPLACATGVPPLPSPPLRAGNPTPINRRGGDPGQAGGSPREPPPPGISQQTFIQHLLCARTWALDQTASFRPVRSAQEGT